MSRDLGGAYQNLRKLKSALIEVERAAGPLLRVPIATPRTPRSVYLPTWISGLAARWRGH